MLTIYTSGFSVNNGFLLSDVRPFIREKRTCYFTIIFDMDDFIHWDDSDLDLDLLLGEYTDCDTERLSDEDCFGGDDMYFDRSEDDKAPSTTSPNHHGKENTSQYACPLCSKTYRSIGGFRGHVSKKHNRSDIKAHEHRLGSTVKNTDNPPSADRTDTHSKEENTPVFLPTDVDMRGILTEVLPKSLSTIILDPMNDASCSLNGPHLVAVAKECSDRPTVHRNLVSVLNPEFHSVFDKFGKGCSLSSDREQLWMKFHQMRLNEGLQSDIHNILVEVTSESHRIIHIFAQCLLDRILRNMLKHLSESIQKQSHQTASAISDNDQAVLYYISGYILHALLKKRAIFGMDIEQHLGELFLLSDATSKEEYIVRFSKWTEKMNRGGLKFPSDNFYLLIRSFEIEIRKHVQLSKLCASSLLCDKLKETVMSSYMVSYYWDKLLSCEDGLKLRVLEFIVDLFLRVRGGDVAKYSKRQLQKEMRGIKNRKGVKRSRSLRGTLKEHGNTN
ncbi:uncharacterized protein LOC124279790 [Haliotis rubra]|uniref:uncharacterized protein LOC124279790 n=1 Tax=Haliotis rubra TaxID=36100 RepID=UPI001EE58884|nr:uncharacterized protein LOC124279790 [Haliotis rubra]